MEHHMHFQLAYFYKKSMTKFSKNLKTNKNVQEINKDHLLTNLGMLGHV